MIGIDTNILIRYIVQDDQQQAALATDFLENRCSIDNPAFVNEITLCEIVWVLKRACRFDKAVILRILEQLLSVSEIAFASHAEAWAAYEEFKTGNADYSDYLIAQLNKKAGCSFTFTFDAKACKNENFKLLAAHR